MSTDVWPLAESLLGLQVFMTSEHTTDVHSDWLLIQFEDSPEREWKPIHENSLLRHPDLRNLKEDPAYLALRDECVRQWRARCEERRKNEPKSRVNYWSTKFKFLHREVQFEGCVIVGFCSCNSGERISDQNDTHKGLCNALIEAEKSENPPKRTLELCNVQLLNRDNEKNLLFSKDLPVNGFLGILTRAGTVRPTSRNCSDTDHRDHEILPGPGTDPEISTSRNLCFSRMFLPNGVPGKGRCIAEYGSIRAVEREEDANCRSVALECGLVGLYTRCAVKKGEELLWYG